MPSGGGDTRTVSTQELAPQQKALLKLVMPEAKNYMNTPLELFPGSTIAGFNPTQEAARGEIASTATGGVKDLSSQSLNVAQLFSGAGGAGGVGGAADLLSAGQFGAPSLASLLGDYQSGAQGRQFIESGALLDPATNPILARQSQAALDPITQRLTQEILPGLRSDFVGGNMFGSSRQGIAERGAVDDFIREAGNITTNLQANNFNQGLGAMLESLGGSRDAAVSATGQALGAGEAGTGALMDAALRSLSMSPSLASLAFLPGMTMEGLGASEQQLTQAQLNEQAQRFTTEQMLPFMQAQDVAQLAFGIGGGTATTNAQQNPAFDPLGTAVGGLMMSQLLLPMLGLPPIPLPF